MGPAQWIGAQLRRTALTGSVVAQAPDARLYHGTIGPSGAVSAAVPCRAACRRWRHVHEGEEQPCKSSEYPARSSS